MTRWITLSVGALFVAVVSTQAADTNAPACPAGAKPAKIEKKADHHPQVAAEPILNNIIFATGGRGGSVTAPLNLSIAPINNFLTFTPSNYLQTYPTSYWPGHTQMKAHRFEWSYSSANNGGDGSGYGVGDGEPDNVYNFGYNLTPQGGRDGLDDASYREAWETNYLIGKRLAFERHSEITDFNNVMHRINSIYTYKDNGESFESSQLESHSYVSVFANGSAGQEYLNIHSIGGGVVGAGIAGEIYFYGDSKSQLAGDLIFNHEGTKAQIRSANGNFYFVGSGKLGDVVTQTDKGQYFLDANGNFFAAYLPNNTLVLGSDDLTKVDNTKKLQVRGDAIVEGRFYLVSPNGTKYKISVSDTGVITATNAQVQCKNRC